MEDLYRIIHDPSKDLYTQLDEQVDAFWEWSKSQKHEYEWETGYENWTLLYALFSKFIETTECSQWTQKTINNLLYLIARDNECGVLMNQLCEKPESLLFLAKEGLHDPDCDARWQLAHYLTQIVGSYPEAEEIICKFSDDQDEYVRRRATLALGTIKSKYAEEKAIIAWNTNWEYQRIAALEVFDQIESEKLEPYLKLALTSEFQYLRAHAEKIRSRIG